jgi:hypothetical protein
MRDSELANKAVADVVGMAEPPPAFSCGAGSAAVVVGTRRVVLPRQMKYVRAAMTSAHSGWP